MFNSLSWPRSALVRAALEFTAPGPASITVRDDSGDVVPCLAEGAQRHPDGTLAAVTLTFRAAGVPALGYRTYWVIPAAGAASEPATSSEPGTGLAPGGWEPQPGTVIENETFLVEADPARGGTLTRIVDKRTGAGLLRAGREPEQPGGNELLLQEEYGSHPRWGEGPWLLSPKGPGIGSGGASAKVTAQRCPLGARLLTELTLGDLRVTQETLLWDGAERIEFRTHVDGSIGQDRLLRVRFPADVPGGLPIYQSATAVVGRPFGSASADVAEHAFTLDNPAHEWFGLGSTARVSWPEPGGGQAEAALGVAEVILPASPAPQDPSFFRNGWSGAIRDLVGALAGQGVTATCSWPDGPRYGSLDLDSNLPDVRIALGGPEQNPWTARLLASAGPGTEGELRRLLAESGSARLWVPAAQSRAAAFGPGADVRGLRDLPVLIVAGHDLAAAAAAVTADLADSVVEVTRLAPDPDEASLSRASTRETSIDGASTGEAALAPRSVALLNRGTPSSLVSPDGTLHIALMRACSAWPCGVWIDGDKRTAPDGSSFAWQHWSHTFEYALAAGPGDWRDAGFAVAGQDYNHDLLACETGLHPGRYPAAASLASAELPVMVSALKPRGNPLAAGRAGPPQRADGVTARLRDLGSRAPAGARLTLFTGITAAEALSLVEDGPVVDGPGRVRAGQAEVTVAAAGTVTLGLSVPADAAGPGPAPAPAPATAPEPAQPVYTRYWMHGKGPAPAGNLPVAVHLSERRVVLPGTAGAANEAAVRLTVACGPEPAAGAVELDVPPGLAATPGGPLRYDLPALGHAHWDLEVRGAPAAAPGHYFLAARIRDQLGQVLEDVTAVMLGGPPLPDLSLPLEALLPALRDDEQAIAAQVQVTVLTPEIRVRPGGHGELAVRVASRAASPVRGEAQLISPYGSWPALYPWTRGFSVSPGKEVTLRYHVGVPITTRHGTRWWTMVKLMYFGRLHYTSSVPVLICE